MERILFYIILWGLATFSIGATRGTAEQVKNNEFPSFKTWLTVGILVGIIFVAGFLFTAWIPLLFLIILFVYDFIKARNKKGCNCTSCDCNLEEGNDDEDGVLFLPYEKDETDEELSVDDIFEEATEKYDETLKNLADEKEKLLEPVVIQTPETPAPGIETKEISK